MGFTRTPPNPSPFPLITPLAWSSYFSTSSSWAPWASWSAGDGPPDFTVEVRRWRYDRYTKPGPLYQTWATIPNLGHYTTAIPNQFVSQAGGPPHRQPLSFGLHPTRRPPSLPIGFTWRGSVCCFGRCSSGVRGAGIRNCLFGSCRRRPLLAVRCQIVCFLHSRSLLFSQRCSVV